MGTWYGQPSGSGLLECFVNVAPLRSGSFASAVRYRGSVGTMLALRSLPQGTRKCDLRLQANHSCSNAFIRQVWRQCVCAWLACKGLLKCSHSTAWLFASCVRSACVADDVRLRKMRCALRVVRARVSWNVLSGSCGCPNWLHAQRCYCALDASHAATRL